MEQCKLIIARPKALFAKMKELSVLVDDQEVGTLSDGTVGEFPLSVGSHKVKVTMEAYSSRPYPIECEAGGEVRLQIVMPHVLFPLFLFITTPGAAFKIAPAPTEAG